ncbi:6343_t:CDS:2 [Paraglomus occultum]|uniref:6343_t:CDS:1 n=1 Tax=Paraglomus occultum TaxID=144539 RepID=A0A9N8WI83_9GLOM|nr:6343_t:CDS:2 [Paraglomus occultum]
MVKTCNLISIAIFVLFASSVTVTGRPLTDADTAVVKRDDGAVNADRVTEIGNICVGKNFDGQPSELCPGKFNTDHKPQKRINMVKRSLSDRETDRIASEGRAIVERAFSGTIDGLRGPSDNEICVNTVDGVKCMPRYGANH